MNIRFSERIGKKPKSNMNEFLKQTTNPGVISFAGGYPASELFPIKEIEKITKEVLINDGEASLQYSSVEGYKPLREIIINQRMPKAKVKANIDNILITTGSQQALELTAKIFIDKDDIIICEKPSYVGALEAFKIYQPKFIEISMDENGMNVMELEEALKKYPNTKMIYTIPDFQNPTGITMSVNRRKKIAELAAEYKVPVLEDSPYSELIFNGEVNPSIKSFDKDGWVIYLGTFSKVFCPGLRMGWVCAEPEILQRYISVKQGSDLNSSTLDQKITAHFMNSYNLDEHIEKVKVIYENRKNAIINSIKKYLPKDVKYTDPNGGLFTWIELKDTLDASKVFEETIKENAAFFPGEIFFANGTCKNHIRLNYSSLNEEDIDKGIEKLGKVLKRYY